MDDADPDIHKPRPTKPSPANTRNMPQHAAGRHVSPNQAKADGGYVYIYIYIYMYIMFVYIYIYIYVYMYIHICHTYTYIYICIHRDIYR